MYVCLCACVCLCLCVFVCLIVYVCASMYIYMCVWTRTYTYIHAYKRIKKIWGTDLPFASLFSQCVLNTFSRRKQLIMLRCHSTMTIEPSVSTLSTSPESNQVYTNDISRLPDAKLDGFCDTVCLPWHQSPSKRQSKAGTQAHVGDSGEERSPPSPVLYKESSHINRL